MTAVEFFHRIRLRRTPQEMVAIVADMAPAEPPTQQEIINQLDVDVVRQFQRIIDAERD